MKKKYENKIVDGKGMCQLVDMKDDGSKLLKEIRFEVLKRSFVYFLDNFDSSFAKDVGQHSYHFYSVAEVFPPMSAYVRDLETRVKFLAFLERIANDNYRLFAEILSCSDNREQLLSLMEDFILSTDIARQALQDFAVSRDETLFSSLKRRGWLDKELGVLPPRHPSPYVFHLEVLKWSEENGTDYLNWHYHAVEFGPVEVIQYLMEKGLPFEKVKKTKIWKAKDLKWLYQYKGMDELRKITATKIRFDFETVKFLRSIQYKFERSKIYRRKFLGGMECYALLCFNVLDFEDLHTNDHIKRFREYILNSDLKACQPMLQFMKETRQKKIVTFLLCMRKSRKKAATILPRQVIWMILDLAYSPVNERGFL